MYVCGTWVAGRVFGAIVGRSMRLPDVIEWVVWVKQELLRHNL